MNDFGNINFHELIERLNLMTNHLLSIGLSDKCFQHMAVAWNEFGRSGHIDEVVVRFLQTINGDQFFVKKVITLIFYAIDF
jgi:hypothetical protein